jgi:heptosyltransferase-2
MAKTELDIRKIDRILIRSTNWVGDAILTTPAIRAVRKNFPDAEVSILAKPWVAPVFYNNPDIDHLLVYDSEGRHKGLAGKVRVSRSLRKGRFDLAVLLQNAFEAALLAYLAGIPRRLGYKTDGRHLLLTHGVGVEPKLREVHETEYYLGILEGAGLGRAGLELTLRVSNEERNEADVFLSKHRVDSGELLVGVSPGATYGPAKRWFPDRFAALCDRLQESYGVSIVILGGPGDAAVGDQVSRSMKNPPVNLCGKTTLRQAISVINKCHLFITNDSGLMHVAAALDIPLVAIFGSTNPVTTGPGGTKSHIVRVPMDCSPCLKPHCPQDHRCMKEITVDKVYEVARAVLDSESAQLTIDD